MSDRARPVAIELCAGGGGLSTGIVQAGFRLAACAEIDENMANIHEENHPSTAHFKGPAGDIRNLKGKDLLAAAGLRRGELDVLAGGPPCQGFSMNGKRDVADPRNSLWKHVVRLTNETQPDTVVVENVPGMMSLAGGAFLQDLIRGLERQNYGVNVLKLNAADFGVPQHRNRIFVVARSDGSIFQAPAALDNRVTVWDAIADLPETSQDSPDPGEIPYARQATSAYAATLRGDMDLVRNCEVTDHAEPLATRISKMKQGDRDEPTRHRRLHARRPSHTLLAGAKTITACRPIHPFRDRVLTVREGARLFGYPDSYRFPRNIQRSWYALGNSVPPPFAAAVFGGLLRSAV